MLESDADRLALIQAVGEAFTTSRAEKLWLIFDREAIQQTLGEFTHEGYGPMGLGRSSDVTLHELVKQSPVTRDADGKSYSVKKLKPDGTGMTLVEFGV